MGWFDFCFLPFFCAHKKTARRRFIYDDCAYQDPEDRPAPARAALRARYMARSLRMVERLRPVAYCTLSLMMCPLKSRMPGHVKRMPRGGIAPTALLSRMCAGLRDHDHAWFSPLVNKLFPGLVTLGACVVWHIGLRQINAECLCNQCAIQILVAVFQYADSR